MPASLLEILRSIPDRRRAEGKRFDLATVFARTVALGIVDTPNCQVVDFKSTAGNLKYRWTECQAEWTLGRARAIRGHDLTVSNQGGAGDARSQADRAGQTGWHLEDRFDQYRKRGK
jgi:hypothetical protein